MTFKLKALVVGIAGVAMSVGLATARADVGSLANDCNDSDGVPVGTATCAFPGFSLAEKILMGASEQTVSIGSGLADGFGCPLVAGSYSVEVNVHQVAGVYQGIMRVDGYTHLTQVQADGPSIGPKQVTQLVTSDWTTGNINGRFHQNLAGTMTMDAKGSIMYGEADWDADNTRLDEHLIKDFYLGAATPATIVDGDINDANDCLAPTLDDILSGACIVADAGDHNPLDPLTPVRVVRDNGLEVITKKVVTENLLPGDPLLDIGAPKGKWRQTSFYRQPNGGGFGRLVFTKVRIAPFKAASCMQRLDLDLNGNQADIDGTGTLIITNI